MWSAFGNNVYYNQQNYDIHCKINLNNNEGSYNAYVLLEVYAIVSVF